MFAERQFILQVKVAIPVFFTDNRGVIKFNSFMSHQWVIET